MTKKTMIAIAALCGAVAFQAKAEIASDIVGYKQTSAGQGVDMGAPAFDAVAGTSVDIQDITPVVGEEEELYSGGVMIMTLTDAGETADTYIYNLAEDAPDGEAGWFDSMTGDRVVKTFNPGEGFATVSDYEAGTLQTSGKVANEETICVVGTGVNSCGNTTSGTLNIDKITVGVGVDEDGNLLTYNEATEEELYSGGVMIMTLTDAGETADTYIYNLAEDAPDGKSGWFDSMTGVRVSVNFEAGRGFVVVSDYTEGCIALPSAL